jgi:hypothetical protein
MSILHSQGSLLNGGNAVGNLNANGGSLTATSGAVANAHGLQFGSNGGSANVLNSPNKGLYAVQGGANSPSHLQKPFPSMSGGGRRRRKSSKTSRRSRKNRHSRSRSRGRKYGRKRVTKTRSRRGGRYAQYMSNVASSFGQTMPGFPLTSKMSALATPTPFRPYQNCPGGL